MRRICGLLVALVLAITLGAIVPDICASLTPDNWILWKLFGCEKDAAGGGGGGAG